ncbi:EKC/KEOPS complex subunit LAGE3-like [Huso huso]|uniref:EKC/KEOPS complex subunit LAGE3-like n=1 Tax=Huso huso TaxID=61971 RepID=A0ABR0Y210_HUSHU
MAAPHSETLHFKTVGSVFLFSNRLAQIAHGSLSPDAEPRKGGISKELRVTDNNLNVFWCAEEARILRVSVGSFLDHLALVLETMQAFGPSETQ